MIKAHRLQVMGYALLVEGTNNMANTENEKIEIELLLQAIYMKYGYDFRDYARASIKRRIFRRLSLSGLKTISEMQHKLLDDKEFFKTLLLDFSINVTEMFRDPSFYKALREKVIPVLRNHSFLRIWHAGCASGEEVYSMAVVLKEEGLLDKAQIYATDVNEEVVKKAKDGIFPIGNMKDYTSNYQKAGGIGSFANYYVARYECAVMDGSLKKNIVFADHNLATDGVFGEMDLVLCRNVVIYFNKQLQSRAIRLFRDSLCAGGFLCLGSKESIRFSEYSDDFEDVVKSEKVYRKKG